MTTKPIHIYFILSVIFLLATGQAYAQQAEPLSLQQALDAALQNNHLLNIKELQVKEKQAKVHEDAIKRYPSVIVNSTYQYNVNVAELVIPEASFGALPLNQSTVIPLPNEDKSFELGRHHNFNAGATLYQPLTQLGKIATGIEIGKTDVLIAEKEQGKAMLQMRQAVEKLYYGLLINQKQQEEAHAKLELARLKLYDVESALLAGKTIDASQAGLQANIADEEQNLLKLQIQKEDYTADLRHLTGLSANSFILEDVEKAVVRTGSLNDYLTSASANNVDVNLATLGQTKTELALKAARQSFLPDLGLMLGYNFQTGNLLYPGHNPFAGVSFRWNIQDAMANREVLHQRQFLLQQARENIANTQQQVNNEIQKAYRKINQAEALVAVAQKAVTYRNEEMKVQLDRSAAGLNTKADVLHTQSLLAKAEADLYAAQLNYLLVQSDLKMLTEGR